MYRASMGHASVTLCRFPARLRILPILLTLSFCFFSLFFSLAFYVFFVLILFFSLELCRYYSSIFLSSRPRTELATAYVSGYLRLIGCVQITHHTHTQMLKVCYQTTVDSSGENPPNAQLHEDIRLLSAPKQYLWVRAIASTV